MTDDYQTNIVNIPLEGKFIWYCDPKESWITLKIKEYDNDKIKGEYNNKIYIIKNDKKLDFVQTEILSINVNDITLLPQINEGSVIYIIGKRYKMDQIYTKIGQIIIAINPYKYIDIDINQYLKLKKKSDEDIDELEPHCYCTAIRAYNYCINTKKSQSIIISGESGAGKTESTKLCLKLLSEIGGNESKIERKLIKSSYILELFGNAKTMRNNNSSRFGKWMQIIIKHEKIIGTVIINYLLEKSRITNINNDERNFHVFYSLLTSSIKDKFKLNPDPKQYKILNMGHCIIADGINDDEFYIKAIEGFDALGIDKKSISNIWNIIIAILLIGNVSYHKQSNNNNIVNKIANILNIDENEFKQAIVSRKRMLYFKYFVICWF